MTTQKENKMISMETLVIKTENKFRTLITKQQYKKGEVICGIPREKVVDKPNRFTVQIDRAEHTDVGKLAALNHSCDPNVILDTRKMQMVARRDIEIGEELYFFYPPPSGKWTRRSSACAGLRTASMLSQARASCPSPRWSIISSTNTSAKR